MIFSIFFKKTENFKEILENLFPLKNNQKIFLFDSIELDIPNILAPYEVYMNEISAAPDEEDLALKDLKETIEICLKQYNKEILLYEKTFYQH